MGDNIDYSLLDDQRMGAQALQSIINRKLQVQAATELGITASESDVDSRIVSMEEFQLNGVFSPDQYRSLLSNAGFSPASFKQSLKEDMVLNQLRSGLAASDFATAKELALNARVSGELRDIRYLTIPLESVTAEVVVSEEEVGQYYEERSAQFLSEETVDLDYIELNVDDFREPVSEIALQELYELEKDGYGYATENRVSHILFIAREGESEEAVKARASAVIIELASGNDFAELAKTTSDDIGSASVGGDLGFSSGDAFPEEMEAAIAGLEVGGVSELTDTDAGVHIIKLTERRDGQMPSLEEMRIELTDRMQLDAAKVELLRTTESLRDSVFNAENLNEPGERLGLTVQKVAGVSRVQQEGLFSNTTLVSAAFSEDVLDGGHNSDVIELSSDHFVVLWVHKHSPAEVMPIDLVREEIVARITQSEALAAVTAEADSALQALHTGTGVETYAITKGYEWQVELAAHRGNSAVPRSILQRAFQLPAPGEEGSEYEFVLAPNGDALVFELTRVTAGDYSLMGARQKQELLQQVSGEFGGLLNVEHQKALRDRADITVI
jgi:peptidyl-prolyl cis-trans isomerase D